MRSIERAPPTRSHPEQRLSSKTRGAGPRKMRREPLQVTKYHRAFWDGVRWHASGIGCTLTKIKRATSRKSRRVDKSLRGRMRAMEPLLEPAAK